MTATTTTPIHSTREGWLGAAVLALTPLFTETGVEIPDVRVSCGFPGGGSARKRIGECWKTHASADGVSQIFVSPTLGEATHVLAVLAHELVHASDDGASGHKGDFRKRAVAIGLAGPMTATHAGPELEERLVEIAKTLGAYPHAALTLGATKTGKGRMVKTTCDAECGFITYTTRKWIDYYGGNLGTCACGGSIKEVVA